jgi:hypothetical protein
VTTSRRRSPSRRFMRRTFIVALALLGAANANAASQTYTADDVLKAYTCGSLDFSAGLGGTINQDPQCENIPPPLRLSAMDAGKAAAKALGRH